MTTRSINIVWISVILATVIVLSTAEEQWKVAKFDNHGGELQHYNLEDEVDTEGMEVFDVDTKVAVCKCKGKARKHLKKHRNRTRPAFTSRDIDELNVVLNAEYLEAEFFLHAAYGFGLDKFNGTSVNITGPAPLGAEKAHTGRFIEHLAKEFGLQSLGHISL